MRLLGFLAAALCISFMQAPNACAQAAEEHTPAATSEPAQQHQHRDHHHGHDQIYPDRGTLFQTLPQGAVAVYHAGLPYKFFNGIWFEQHGQAYIVVSPAIGAVVTALPASMTPVENGGESYLYANEIFYRPRPDLGGYEVVNDPEDAIPPAEAKPLPDAPAPVPASPTATPNVNAAVPAAMTAASVTAVAAGASAATPAASVLNAQAAPRGVKVVATPKNGQSADVQAHDHYECYKAAVAHSGFDPMHVNGNSASAQVAEQQSDYERTQAACFESRGYSIQ